MEAAATGWPSSVQTRVQLRGLGNFTPGVQWKEFSHSAMELAVGVETLPSDGESYIGVYGYVYNRHFREWRRFVAVQLRGAGVLEVRLDAASGMLTAVGAANNELRDRALFGFDLRAVHDDR